MSPEPPWDRRCNVLRYRLVAQGGRFGAVLRGGVVENGRVASYAEPRMVVIPLRMRFEVYLACHGDTLDEPVVA